LSPEDFIKYYHNPASGGGSKAKRACSEKKPAGEGVGEVTTAFGALSEDKQRNAFKIMSGMVKVDTVD
jgi:hypothetical protein